MPAIKGPVGDKETNAIHDVALVQAMLQAIRDPRGRPYYGINYDGLFSQATSDAILAFQRDHGLIQTDRGSVTPGGASLKRMSKLLPPALRDIMIMKDTRIVYLAAPQQLFRPARGRIRGHKKLDQSFARDVERLFDEMYAAHGIGLSINKTNGHFRTFQMQFAIMSILVGPGESDHNYGFAVDAAFNLLELIHPDGSVVGDDSSLNLLKSLDLRTWLRFWAARDRIAKRLGLFTISTSDRAHLQRDANKSPGKSLVALLNRHKTMKWGVRSAKPNIFKTDLGFGGKLIEVGNSTQIWKGEATLSPKKVSLAMGVAAIPVKTAEVKKLKKALRAEFEWAEKNWKKWRPVR